MKSVIAYASTILGLTQLVGMLVGNIVSLPVAMAVPHHLKLRIVPLLEVFPGAAALVAAITLFWLLSVPVTIFVPLIVAGWLTFYFLAYYQSRVEWYASVAGVFICWIIYRTALLLLAPRVEGVAAVDVWQQLGGWFVTGLIASLFFTLLAMTRRKVQRRRNDREEPVKSKTDNTELTSSQDEPGEKARTGLQVMNGMFVLFCGYVFLTGRFVLSPIDWFVWILFNFGFIAAYVLAFLAAGNPKHDTKRK